VLRVRVEWARTSLISSYPYTLVYLLISSLLPNEIDFSPRELLQRKRVLTSHLDQDSQPEFAKAWLAYHGFSSEFARGPQTPNLFCAHEKWCKLMPESVSPDSDPVLGNPFLYADTTRRSQSSRILFSWIHFPSMMIHHLTSDFQQPGTKQTYRGQPAPTSPRISREPMLPLSPLSLSSRVRPHSRSAPAAIMTSSSVLSPAASLPPPNTPRGSSVSTQHSINDLRPFPIIFFATSLHCGFPP
jgi:hypothetical protein